MVMERLNAAGGDPRNQDPERQAANRIELRLEWQRQAERYVALGFHIELGLSDEDYLASLPRFKPQPEIFRGRFDIPVLVETRIAPSRQAELAGVAISFEGYVRDWESDPSGYKTPDSPYTTWMQDGNKNLGKSVRNVRQTLEADERGATVYDGVALWIANPIALGDHYIDLPGTSVESDFAPFLSQWFGWPEVGYYLVDGANSKFGSASCGRVAV